MSTDGHVVAVNVAVVRTDPWTEVKSGRSGIDKRPVDGPVRLLSYGVAGDTICDTANHGGSDQAVYAYACEDLAFWAAELGQRMDPGGVGENLTLSAVDCSAAVVGERWQVGAVMAAMTVDRRVSPGPGERGAFARATRAGSTGLQWPTGGGP